MKPALFHTVLGSGYRPCVIAVTTEKPNQWYGRRCDTIEATHGDWGDVKGRFPTEAAAQAKVDAIRAVIAEYKSKVKVLDDQRSALRRMEAADIARVLGEGNQ